MLACVVAAATLVPVSAAGAATSVTVPTSIDKTGTKNVTAPLNTWLSHIPNDATITFPSNAKYRIEGTLQIQGKRNWTIVGNGALFFATTNGLTKPPAWCGPTPELTDSAVCRYPNRTRSQFNIIGASTVTIRNVKVRGSSKATGPNGTYSVSLEAQHGFNIARSTGVVLDGVNVGGVWGDLVYVGQASSNVTVKNSMLNGSSRQGVAITNANRVTFVGNTIKNTRRSLFDLEPNITTDVIANITIRNNDIGVSRFCTLNSAGPAATVRDITFDGNRMHGKRLAVCVWGYANKRRQRITVTNNVGDLSANEPSITLGHVDGAVVTGNRQTFSTLWPTRDGPQAPILGKCSTGIVQSSNQFTPLPAGMPKLVNRPC